MLAAIDEVKATGEHLLAIFCAVCAIGSAVCTICSAIDGSYMLSCLFPEVES